MTDLTDKMRTCAAALASRLHDSPMPNEHMMDDAMALLIEASNALEAVPEPLGEPMEIIPTVPPTHTNPWVGTEPPRAAWTSGLDTLPPPTPGASSVRPNRVCPMCDSHANKRVYRDGAKLYLACPVCATAWEYRP